MMDRPTVCNENLVIAAGKSHSPILTSNANKQFLPALVIAGTAASGSPCSIISSGSLQTAIAPPPTPVGQLAEPQLCSHKPQEVNKEGHSPPLVLPAIVSVDGNVIPRHHSPIHKQLPVGRLHQIRNSVDHYNCHGHSRDRPQLLQSNDTKSTSESVRLPPPPPPPLGTTPISEHCVERPSAAIHKHYYSQQVGIRPILSAKATLSLLSSIDFRELRESFTKRNRSKRNRCGNNHSIVEKPVTDKGTSKCTSKDKTGSKKKGGNLIKQSRHRAMLKPRYSSLVIEGLSIKNPYELESAESTIVRSSSEIALPTYNQTGNNQLTVGTGQLKKQRSVSLTSLNRVIIEFNRNLRPTMKQHIADASRNIQLPQIQKRTVVAPPNHKPIDWSIVRPNKVSFTVTAPLPPLVKNNLFKPRLTQFRKPMMKGYLVRKRISSEVAEFPDLLTPNTVANHSSSYVSRSTHLRQGNKSKMAEYTFKIPQRYPDLSVSGEHIQSYSDLSEMAGNIIQSAFYTVNAMIENSEERLRKLRQQRKERRLRRRQLRKLAGLSTESSSTDSDTYSDDDDLDYDSVDSIEALLSDSTESNLSSLDKATAAAKRKSKRRRNRQRLKKMAQMLGGGVTGEEGVVDLKQQLRKKRLIEKLRKKGINVVSEEEAEKIIMLAMADMSQLEILEIMEDGSARKHRRRKDKDKRKRRHKDEGDDNMKDDRGSGSRRSRRKRQHERRRKKHHRRTHRVIMVDGEEVVVSESDQEEETDEDGRRSHRRHRRGQGGRRHHRRRRTSGESDGDCDDRGSRRKRRRRKERERRRRHRLREKRRRGQAVGSGDSMIGLTDSYDDEYSTTDYYTSDDDYSSDYTTYGSSSGEWDSSDEEYTPSSYSSGYSDSDYDTTSDDGSIEGEGGGKRKRKKKGLSRKHRRRAAHRRRRKGAEGSGTEWEDESTVYSTEYDSDGNVVNKGGKRRKRKKKGRGSRRRRRRGDSVSDDGHGSRRKQNKRKHRSRKKGGSDGTGSVMATEGNGLEISRPNSTIAKPPTRTRTKSGRLITTQRVISGPMEHDQYSNAFTIQKHAALPEKDEHQLNEEEKKLLRKKMLEESLMNDFEKEEAEMRRIKKIQKEARIKAQQEMAERKKLEEQRAEVAYARKEMEKKSMVKQLEKLKIEIENRRSFHLYHRAVVDEYYEIIEKWDEVDYAIIENQFGSEYRDKIVNIDKERKLAEAILMEQFFIESFELKRQELLIKLKQAHERFTKELASEILGLDTTARISRAFVTSYYSILDNHDVLY